MESRIYCYDIEYKNCNTECKNVGYEDNILFFFCILNRGNMIQMIDCGKVDGNDSNNDDDNEKLDNDNKKTEW